MKVKIPQSVSGAVFPSGSPITDSRTRGYNLQGEPVFPLQSSNGRRVTEAEKGEVHSLSPTSDG